MANPTFSNLSGRASGTLSGSRGRSGTLDSGRYDSGYAPAPRQMDGYGPSYRGPVGNPYDDIDDVSGIGEVRVRAASTPSSSRYHPPLLSFNEARTNTYVTDRARRDALDRTRTARRFEHPGAGYTPRVREAVNMGYSSAYSDDALGGEGPVREEAAPAQPAAAPAAAAQPLSASGTPLSASGFDPFASRQAASQARQATVRRLTVLAPADYAAAADVARALKAGDAVALVLSQLSGELAKRLLDFSFGAAAVVDAGVECIADKVFFVAHGQGITEPERDQLRSRGIVR